MQPHPTSDRAYRLPGLHGAPQDGFALVAALLACMILLALGMLVVHLSTQDLRVSTKVVGDKKALSAAETGIHTLVQNFDPEDLAASATASPQVVDSANDAATKYSIATPEVPTTGSGVIPMSGYNIAGGQIWGRKLYDVDVTGENTAYDSRVEIGVGLGYGPIDITTMSR